MPYIMLNVYNINVEQQQREPLEKWPFQIHSLLQQVTIILKRITQISWSESHIGAADERSVHFCKNNCMFL